MLTGGILILRLRLHGPGRATHGAPVRHAPRRFHRGRYGNHKNDEALLEQPRAGDIYTVRNDSSGRYSLLKVVRAGGNGVELVANEFETEASDPINSINRESRYSQDTVIVTRLDLQIMRRKGELTDVDRLGE